MRMVFNNTIKIIKIIVITEYFSCQNNIHIKYSICTAIHFLVLFMYIKRRKNMILDKIY